MKKILLIILYAVALSWAILALNSESEILADDIQGHNSAFIAGEIIGVFIFITTPLGIVIAIHNYSNKKQEKINHAV